MRFASHSTRRAAGVFGALLLTAVAGCPFGVNPFDPNGTNDPFGNNSKTPIAAELIAFDSPEDLLEYFQNQALRQIEPPTDTFGGFFGLFGPTVSLQDSSENSAGGGRDGASDTASPEPTGAEAGDGDFSTTNLQVVDVDESDVFKTDGTYLYIQQGNILRIIQAAPLSALGSVGEIEIGDRIDEFYLFDHYALVLGVRYERVDPDAADNGSGSAGVGAAPTPLYDGYYDYYYTETHYFVAQVDLADPTNPAIVHQLEVDGSIYNSRLTDGRLVLVTNYRPSFPYDRTGVAELTLDDLMPRVRTASGAAAPIVHWSGWLHPAEPDGYATTTVMTIDASNIESILGSLAIVGDTGVIYMSTDALYLTDDDYSDDYGYRPMTGIHKITFDDNGVPHYAASGTVPGRLLNQFSLDEHDGYLRMATHVEDYSFFIEPWFDDIVFAMPGVSIAVADVAARAQSFESVEPTNAIWVLGQLDAKLEVAGAIEDIAPGEDIYSTRFMGDHGFLVTFRQIDPLFVLDLSDPTAPFLAGELKIPGFSEYLHPIGENHLLGIGQSTTDAEWGGTIRDGIQLSLFDVTDWANPSVVEQITVGADGSTSDVATTHKAFTYRPSDGLLALPAVVTQVVRSRNPWPEYEYLEQVLLYQISTDTGFEEVGTLDVALPDPNDFTDAYNYWAYQNEWRRAAIIGDDVYAVAPSGVQAAPLADLTATAVLRFPIIMPYAVDYYPVSDADGGDE